MKFKLLCIASSIVLIPVITSAQIRSANANSGSDYYGFAFDIGLTSFYGDIDNGPAQGNLLKNNVAYQFLMARNFNSIFEADFSFSFGKLSGQKDKTSSGSSFNQYFKASFLEYSVDGSLNLLAFFTKKYDSHFAVYGKVGIGLIDFKTKLYNAENDSLIKSYGYGDQKSTTELSIPVGIKVLYHLTPSSAISLQTTMYRVNTDKLDDVTGNSNSDYYNFFSLGYSYKINLANNSKRLLRRH